GFLLNIEIDTGVKLLYVSEDILQKDSNGEAINVITKDEFVNFFGVMEPFIEIVMPFIEGNFDPENMINEVFGLLRDERINQIIDCKLIEGTLSNLLVSFLKDNGLIIIPQEMKNGVGMVSTPDKDSEIKLLCNVFRNTNIDISGLIGSENIMGELSKINEQELELLLTSGILHHTVSNFIYADRRNLIADFALVVPNSVMKDGVIEKNSIISFLDIILDLLPNENEEFDSNLLVDKIRNNTNTYLSNEIMSATLSYAFVNNQSIKDSLGDILIVPTSLKTPALNIDTFESGFANTGWKEELLDLFTSFDILIGSDDINSLSNNIVQTVLSLNEYYDYYNKITKLQKIYESNIMSASISNQLDMQIIDNNIVSDDIAVTNRVLASAHDNSGCFKFEEVEALLDSFVIFGITASGNNISINPEELIKNITGDLMNYNNPCEAIERYNTLPLDMRPSTLDIIYGSAVIRSLVSEKLREILSDSNGLGLTEQYNKILVDEFDNYKKEEVKALIKLLEILEISGDSLTSDDSKESINAKLSDGISKIRENLDSLYDGSKMVGVIIHKKLQDNGF
ncbi:MAG: hypothetical protein J6R47_04785, partial [Acholeplasmatales bacterium]|nr:hypothetical protein [Acholeplasmatales bacterium]